MQPLLRQRQSQLEREAAFTQAARLWEQISSEPDCWTNPVKRQELLRIRLAYQDAKLFCLCETKSRFAEKTHRN